MEEQIYGYVRVSAKDQNEARQMIAMNKFGITKEHIYLDKQSGKDFNRPAYQKLFRKLKEKDTLVVMSIDRLGRNYDEILEQWRKLTKEKKVSLVVLDMPLLNSQTGRDLTGTLISDIVLQLLSYVAQTEREKIKERQRQGIDAALQRGVKFGRKEKIPPENYEAVKKLWMQGQISAREAGKQLDVTHCTFLRWTKNGR